MSESDERKGDENLLGKVTESTIRIGMVVLLAACCFLIVQPFILPAAWGIIIAVALHPTYEKLVSLLAGRRKLTASLVTVMMLLVLIVPTVLLGETLVRGGRGVADTMLAGGLKVPEPPESVADWPVIGEPLYRVWKQGAENLPAALEPLAPYLKKLGAWVISAVGSFGMALVQFVISIVIAGILLATAGAGGRVARAVGTRLAGARGEDLVALSESTVRSVARGILGVSIIQSLLAGLGFLAVGVPAAGLWALIGLILSVVQIGVIPVTLPIVIWVFATHDTVPAVIFAIWCLFVSTVDNILKPFLLGRGARTPMVVIFVGSIGGFLAWGIVGLFIGAVVLALGYTLGQAWMGQSPPTDETAPEGGAI